MARIVLGSPRSKCSTLELSQIASHYSLPLNALSISQAGMHVVPRDTGNKTATFIENGHKFISEVGCLRTLIFDVHAMVTCTWTRNNVLAL